MDKLYINYVLSIIPQILTHLDRDPQSPTYGCRDRFYWHYKMRDFPSAILQESCLFLALLYKNDFQGNIYYRDNRIFNWAIAMINYAIKIQNNDGSFSQYWLNEKSYPTTAFVISAVCEACEILNYFPNNFDTFLKKAVKFLLKNDELMVQNQQMASIVAVYYAGKIMKIEKYKVIAKKKYTQLIEMQTADGFFYEYGGADFGYSTMFLDYLISYYVLTKDKRSLDVAKKIINFIKYFVFPDDTFGGECGSRNTNFILPYGLMYMKNQCVSAKSILMSCCHNITYPESLMMPCSSFVKALLLDVNNSVKKNSDNENYKKLPVDLSIYKYFQNAKMIVVGNVNYYFVSSLLKGGVFRLYDKKNNSLNIHCGYRFKKRNNFYVTEWPTDDSEIHIKKSNNKIDVNIVVPFIKRKFYTANYFNLNLLRIASLVLGRFLIICLKKILIYEKNKVFNEKMYLKRQFVFYNNRILVNDYIYTGINNTKLEILDSLSMRYVPSSNYFQEIILKNKINYEIKDIDKSKNIRYSFDFK